ncbi:HAD-IC family P-type ATPase, partial [Pediococcus acidilactici]|uniref:HAD-IC family P-type ATPase n=1 Tax=Pediococcus acidilactici TaxID=1254 RepID=UPI002A6FD6F7|nr:HAD-IC family P-type ATPase [Pediococcus acidilactici]
RCVACASLNSVEAKIAPAMLVGIYGYLTKIYSLPVLVIALITMIVGSLPEGLPASTSVVLAMGINKMTKQNAIVKSLPAVETLGSVNVIATDKTGTLTKNEMTVESVVTKQHEFEVTGTGYQPEGTVCLNGQPVQLAEHPDLQKLILAGYYANDTELTQTDGQWQINGEPTDGAFLTLANKAFQQRVPEWTEVDMIPFDSDYRYIAELSQSATGEKLIYVKGS